MKQHRVIKKTFANGKTVYRVQERVLYFFWAYVERDYFFNIFLSGINNMDAMSGSGLRHPANLVGRSHTSYIDALEEISYHEESNQSLKVTKKEIV